MGVCFLAQDLQVRDSVKTISEVCCGLTVFRQTSSYPGDFKVNAIISPTAICPNCQATHLVEPEFIAKV